MKKTFLAIALAMMSILFAGCNKDIEPDRGVAQKIIGKWIYAETDGKVLPTNEKIVYEFVSATKAYVSLSFTDDASSGTGAPWTDRKEVDVDIVGNDVTLTHSPEPGKTVIVEIHVNAITGTTMIGKRRVTIRQDGGLVKSDECMLRCEKVNVDYSTDILGLWEGKMTSDQSAFDDGQEHRWEFKEDGTFVFYIKNSKGIWEAKDDEFSQWFVAGNLLCTRWKNAGEGAVENREWWEIAAVGEKSMVWTALRENADGSQYTAAFSMDKISFPTQAEVEAAIRGKWMNVEVDGVTSLTDEKSVTTILTLDRGAISASVYGMPGMETVWSQLEEVDVEIQDNLVTLINHPDEKSVFTAELFITSINAQKMQAIVTLTLTENGMVVGSGTSNVLYEKVTERFGKAIVGVWEGRMTEGKSAYDDGEYHRWEYLEDGTFNFYRKVGDTGSWEKVADDFAEYFVDGRLLCTRWQNVGAEERREWWEIRSIENDTMIWTALREDEVGNRYVASFAMTKLNFPSKAEIEKNITGKWITQEIEGDIALTNDKVVFTMPSKTVAFISASLDNIPGESDWVFQREYEMSIENNIITLVHEAADGHTKIIDEIFVFDINAQEMECLLKRKVTYDDEVTKTYPPVELMLVKQPKTKYASYILGTWEGRITSNRSAYDDGQMHRWEFNGSSYVYYVKDGNNWVPSSNTKNEYFVDGDMLCMRWVDNDVEYREWWEIMSLDNESMIWGALRQDDTGDLYAASFAMTKVAPYVY